jgi:hypothetical protein
VLEGRKLFEAFASSLGFDPLDPHNWYEVTSTDLPRAKVRKWKGEKGKICKQERKLGGGGGRGRCKLDKGRGRGEGRESRVYILIK